MLVHQACLALMALLVYQESKVTKDVLDLMDIQAQLDPKVHQVWQV